MHILTKIFYFYINNKMYKWICFDKVLRSFLQNTNNYRNSFYV